MNKIIEMTFSTAMCCIMMLLSVATIILMICEMTGVIHIGLLMCLLPMISVPTLMMLACMMSITVFVLYVFAVCIISLFRYIFK